MKDTTNIPESYNSNIMDELWKEISKEPYYKRERYSIFYKWRSNRPTTKILKKIYVNPKTEKI